MASLTAPAIQDSAAGSNEPLKLAVLGADEPVGAALLQQLDEDEMRLARLFALSLGQADSSVSYQGSDWPCESMEDFDYAIPDVLLVTSRSPAAQRQVRRLQKSHPQLPILTLEEAPSAAALATTRVVRVLTALGGSLETDVFVALPVTDLGQAGIEELAGQTRGLFNMESPEPEAFPLQIAFNLIPYGNPDGTAYEAALKVEAESQVEGASVNFSVVWAPLFHGAAAMLHSRLTGPIDIQALRNGFHHQEGIVLMEADLAAGTPTPATDAQESDKVFVGRLRVEGNRVKLWMVFDPSRLEAASLAQRLENWIDYRARSMLT